MSKIIRSRKANKYNAVVTIEGKGGHMRSPCPGCPWKRANAGNFPAEAFRLSADTASDASFKLFACHTAGIEHQMTCAGFLLSVTAIDNVAVRIMLSRGGRLDVTGGEDELFPTYKQMAMANGCKADDPKLAACMPEARQTLRELRRSKR